MSVAFNSGPSAAPLARMIAAFVASRAGRPPSASSRDGGGGIRDRGIRDRGIRAAAMSSLPYGLWRDRGGTLDITSAQNPKVKLIRSFHKRRTRDDGGKILAEGHRLVCDLIEGGLTPTLVIVSPEALRASPGPRLQAALETLSADVVAVAPAEVVQRCCDTVTSQGVVALVERPVLPLPPTLQTVLICDGIQDPGNLGTLVRTAAGLGADAVVLTGSCVDYWAPKTVRASMGASFRLPSLRLESWQEVVELMRARGIRMYAADGGARLSHFDADWTSPSALVVGAEARGPEACWSFGDRLFHTGWTAAAPAARGVTPGGRICPAVAAAGETAGAQALVEGAAASVAASAARESGDPRRPGFARGGGGRRPGRRHSWRERQHRQQHRWREGEPPAVMCSLRRRPWGRPGCKHSQLVRYNRYSSTGGETVDPWRQGFRRGGDGGGGDGRAAGPLGGSGSIGSSTGGERWDHRQSCALRGAGGRPGRTHSLANGAAAPLMGAATIAAVTVTVATEGGLGYRTP